MTWTKPFSIISKDDTLTAGGKGASLGEMTRAGIPVPPGFVVLSEAFECFIEETDLNVEIDTALHSVNPQEMHTIEAASEKIQALILATKMPEDVAQEIKDNFTALGSQYVAVRSSATAEDSASAAWAGQLDSFLNTTEDTLLENVQRCWASLFTPRAIFYRFEQNLHQTKISVAVVVQKMVESEVSGIAFSVHPVTEDPNQLIIEAGFGLGEAIVSGQITPDSYVVEKEPRRIIDANVNTQARALYRAANGGNELRNISEPHASAQVLTEAQIFELSNIVLTIEHHYGFPCDIEWAYEQGTFYITQSRPITTLAGAKSAREANDSVSVRPGSQAFECTVRFPFTPVISVEAMNEGWCNNPLFDLADTPPNPTIIVYSGSQFEEWTGSEGRIVVSSPDAITEIEEAALSCIPRNRAILEGILTADDKVFVDPETLVTLIEQANTASADIYKYFAFFIDESFRTKNQATIEHLQQTRMELDALVVQYLFPVFEKIVQALIDMHHFPRAVAERATTAEIITALHNSSVLPREGDFHERPIIFKIADGHIETIVNQEAQDIRRYLAQQDPDILLAKESADARVLRGSVGNPGVATGKVHKLLAHELYSPEKLRALEQDQDYVFVVPMTAPELVPHFKNAKAFVTNEGGITCHAAIIARELGKPCIIGTKVATQVLHDGDLVEVDADNGVVRVVGRV